MPYVRKMYVCILPGGNADEFPKIDAECVRRRAHVEYCNLRARGRMYHVPDHEMVNLPHDIGGPYLGDDDSGHGLSLLPVAHVDKLREEWGAGPWLQIPMKED